MGLFVSVASGVTPGRYLTSDADYYLVEFANEALKMKAKTAAT